MGKVGEKRAGSVGQGKGGKKKKKELKHSRKISVC